MAVDNKAKRIEVLLAWRELVAGYAEIVPSEADLTKIGAAGELWPPYVDLAVVEPWRETIAFLFKQVKFGVADPVSRLPDDLRQPAPVEMTMADRLLAELRSWRAAAVASKVPGIAGLKDVHLNVVVRSGSRTVEAISAVLPASLADFAPDLAEIIAEVTDAEPIDADPPDADPLAGWIDPSEPTRPTVRSRPQAPTSEGAPARAVTDPQVPRGAPAQTGPVGSPVAPPAGEPDGDDLSGLTFARYDFAGPTSAHARLTAVAGPAGGLTLSWPAIERARGTVIYRVVSDDSGWPYSPDPDAACQVAATTGLTAADPRPFEKAVRYLRVWCHIGSSVADAAATLPVLHAQHAVVAPLQNPAVREDHGRVVGRWTALKGTTVVEVRRFPIDRAAQAARDPQYRTLTDVPDLGGFVDTGAEPGRTYRYQAFAGADVDGVCTLSTAVSREVLVPAVLVPVTDLDVTSRDHDVRPVFDLSWTRPPAGEVQVHRTEVSPLPGAGERAMPLSALEQTGLTRVNELLYRSETGADGRLRMTSVPWPPTWNRAYFTPVTVLDGMAHVGSTVTATRADRIVDAKIVERTHKQVLTFAWPAGAASVHVHVGVPDQDAASAMTGRPMEISRKQYERWGGLHFVPPLPYQGCSVHLVPVTFERGQQVTGPPFTLRYPGILRLSYSVEVKRGGLGGRAVGIEVRISSEFDRPNAPPFALVHHPDRFPLETEDGQCLFVARAGEQAPTMSRLFVPPDLSTNGGTSWHASAVGLTGFIRLFVALPPERLARVALLDPPISSLRLEAAPGRKGLRR